MILSEKKLGNSHHTSVVLVPEASKHNKMSLQCLQIIVKDTFDGIINDVLIAKWVLMQLSCHLLKKHNFKAVEHIIYTRTVIS